MTTELEHEHLLRHQLTTLLHAFGWSREGFLVIAEFMFNKSLLGRVPFSDWIILKDRCSTLQKSAGSLLILCRVLDH